MCIQPHGTALQVTVTDMMYSLVRWKTKTTANFSLIRRDRIQLLKSDFRRYTNEKLLQIFRIKTQKKTKAGVNNQESLQRTDEMLNLKKKITRNSGKNQAQLLAAASEWMIVQNDFVLGRAAAKK